MQPAKEPSPSLLVSIVEAARLLGIGRNGIYNLMASGAIRSTKIGQRRLIARSELERYVALAARGGA